MDFLLEALTNWLKEMLVGGIMSNLSGMFDSVNQQVADISVQVGQTPQGWNGSIFNMIENLSNSIMVPIAGVILTIVMTVDLIQMIADKNNLHDVDTWMILDVYKRQVGGYKTSGRTLRFNFSPSWREVADINSAGCKSSRRESKAGSEIYSLD